jgi:beta-lactam-binding protein with PASTA domain/predicted Ser/Thr protein kinase
MAEFDPGAVLDGRYRVISRLGAGGMADVYLAEDQQLSRKVALKLLHRRFAEDPGFVERFRREAQAAASLQHPCVVQVYDRGEFDGTYYIAMEYLPGRTLKQLIRQEAPLAPIRAIDIAVQILKAARFAHRRGVIHRDLKPHNVIIDENDNAKVTDFGIARAGASDMTETGSIMGTAQYLSPEQAQGHAVSETSDLYSVGIVLYEMLTGRVPFDAESAVTIALKHVSEAPEPPTRINPQMPVALEQVVMWALNKDPAHRPADADQFIAVLEQVRESLLAGRPAEITASMAAVGVAAAAAAATQPATALMPSAAGFGAYGGAAPPLGPEPPPVREYEVEERPPLPPPEPGGPIWPWLLALLIVLLLAGGGVAAYLLTRPHKGTVPPVVNLQVNIAEARVTNAGFNPVVSYQTSSSPQNTVIRQNPLGGVRVDDGSTVTLIVSQGPGNVSIPPVDGLSRSAAERLIRKAGLKVAHVFPESSATVPKGQATRTDPAAGTPLQAGSGVTLYISSGKPAQPVPDVTGDTQSAAKNTLTAAGFKVSVTQQPSSSNPPNTVISQTPSGGGSAPAGSTVAIVVATAPTTASVPPVVGDTAAAAQGALRSAGFTVNVQRKKVKAQNEDGIVVKQSPAAGVTAKKGSAVTIVVGKYSGGTTTTTTTGQPTTTGTTSTTTTTPGP